MRVAVVLLVGLTLGAAPPAKLTQGQLKQERERDALFEKAHIDWKAGRQAEALAGMGKALALTKELVGPQGWDTHQILSWLAVWEEKRGRWPEGAEHRERMWRIVSALRGADDWRAGDARRTWQEDLSQARRTPKQREALSRADRVSWQAEALMKKGDTAKAVPLARETLEIRREILGEKHPEVAQALSNLAYLHRAVGDRKAALPLRQQALAARREVLGETHPKTASSYFDLALLHDEMGEKVLALALHARGLAIRTKALGPRHPARADSLSGMARVHESRGEYGRALPLAEEAFQIYKEAVGERHPDFLGAISRLSKLYQATGDYKNALPHFQKAADLVRKLRGERNEEYATNLNNLAFAHAALGEHAKALPLYQRALDITGKTRGVKHSSYAITLHNLAILHKEMADHARSRELFEQALSIQEAAGKERDVYVAHTLGGLAHLYQQMGEHSKALPLYRRALAITRRSLGEGHPDYASALNNLAFLHASTGDYARALPLYQRSLDTIRKTRGERHPYYGTTLDNLGLLYQSMGDHTRAMPLCRQALEIHKDALGENHPLHATTLDSLGRLHRTAGDHDRAILLCTRALEIRREVLGQAHPDYANSLDSVAKAHLGRGDHARAWNFSREAVALNKHLFGEKHPRLVSSLNNQAVILEAMGKHRQALPLYEQAFALDATVGGEDRHNRASILNNLAKVHLTLDRPGVALRYQEQALSLARRDLAFYSSIQSERQQRAATQHLRQHLNVRLSIPDEAAHFSHSHVLAWKGSAFTTQMARRRYLLAEADPATRDVARELRDKTRTLALLSSRPDVASRKRAEVVALEKEALEVRLAGLSSDYRLAHKPPASESFRASLPVGVALIDFLEYTGLDPAKPVKGQDLRRRLAAWIVRADAPTVRIDLGPTAPVEREIEAWRAALELARPTGDAPARLRKTVWTPLEKHIAGAKVVLVSPDGPLGRLPFAALPGRKAGATLLEEVPLAVLPVPQVLTGAAEPSTGTPTLVAVGGVEFGAGRWASLPATTPEADAVLERFRAQFRGDAISLFGAKATKAILRETLPGRRFAHIATHGYFAPASMKSTVEVGGPELAGLFGREGVMGWDPGLLSGLVLAGANRPTEEDDGVLTASEVAEMDLSRVELAVLSACQTGLGKEAAGEGMLGLQRAFALAGCKAVVSSLWSVDDAATAVLMERFYLHLWEKKVGKLQALRQAQLDVMRHPEWVEQRVKKLSGTRGMRGVGKVAEIIIEGKRERRSPPAWWAAWQLSGDWR